MKPQATKKRTIPTRNDVIDGFVSVISKARKPTEIDRFRHSCARVIDHIESFDAQERLELLGHLQRVAMFIDDADITEADNA